MQFKSAYIARTMAAVAMLAGAAVASLPAFAADSTIHIRGRITALSDHGFTMQTNDGNERTIRVTDKTQIAAVSPGDLSSIQKGTFIGTANVKDKGRNRALEMVIFPPAMKGAGLGNYGWDLTPSMVGQSAGSAGGTAGMTAGGSSMTNGTVTAKSDGGAMTAGSSMTNGTVTGQSGGAGKMTLHVDYGNGTKTIVVPGDIPTVKVQPGHRSDLKVGAHVFVAGPPSQDTVDAGRVIVGLNGTVPPM